MNWTATLNCLRALSRSFAHSDCSSRFQDSTWEIGCHDGQILSQISRRGY